jgi:hypothetical protein
MASFGRGRQFVLDEKRQDSRIKWSVSLEHLMKCGNVRFESLQPGVLSRTMHRKNAARESTQNWVKLLARTRLPHHDTHTQHLESICDVKHGFIVKMRRVRKKGVVCAWRNPPHHHATVVVVEHCCSRHASLNGTTPRSCF